EFFFVHEHFTRYLTTTHRREGSWWSFVPLLLVGLLPWTSALPWLGRTVYADSQRPARILLVAWCGFVLVFFSLSGSKLPSYILPMFPALALLCAHALRVVSPAALRRHLLVLVALWVALAAVATTQQGRFVSATTTSQAVSSLALGVAIGAIFFLCGAALAWWCLKRDRVTAAVVSIGAAHLIALSIILQAHDVYGQLRSSKQIAQLLRAHEGGTEVPVFTVATYDQTLPFYLGRNVVLVDYVDEFALGQRLEPSRAMTTLAQFIAQWNELPRAAAYMKPQTFDEMERAGLRMRVVFRDPRRVVVTKP
ncbi:MAG: glycosyltransferase family 39 protein, partial [Burkholderiaceae bacterium]